MRDYQKVFDDIRAGLSYPKIQAKHGVSSATISQLKAMTDEGFLAFQEARQEQTEKIPIRPADSKPLTGEQVENKVIRKTQDGVISEITKKNIGELTTIKQGLGELGDLSISDIIKLRALGVVGGNDGRGQIENREIEALREQNRQLMETMKTNELKHEIASLVDTVKQVQQKDSLGGGINSPMSMVLKSLIESQSSNKDQTQTEMFKFLNGLTAMNRQDQDRYFRLMETRNNGGSIGRIAEDIEHLKKAGEIIGLKPAVKEPGATEIVSNLIDHVSTTLLASPGVQSYLSNLGNKGLSPAQEAQINALEQQSSAPSNDASAVGNPQSQVNTPSGFSEGNLSAPSENPAISPEDYYKELLARQTTPDLDRVHGNMSDPSNISTGSYERISGESRDAYTRRMEALEREEAAKNRRDMAIKHQENEKKRLAYEAQNFAGNLVNLSYQK